MFVKICGITDVSQVDWAIELGYDAMGVVLHPESKRYCMPQKALSLARYAAGKIKTVAVGVTFNEVAAVCSAFDFIQVYEPVSAGRLPKDSNVRVIFASPDEPVNADFDYFLFDMSRGSGKISRFPAWLENYRERLIVAGGLSPGNVRNIIEKIRPFGVDVSSGVEMSGRKNHELMKQFIGEVRNA